MKKIVSLIVILTLLITTLTAFALPASAAVYSGDCGVDGSDLRWSLDTNKGTLTISGSGAMQDFETEAPWYSYREEITTIHLPAELTSIGMSSFSGFVSLKEIVIPSNVTKIGDFAFSNCYALERVVLSEKLTSIGMMAFFGGDQLKEITIPASVTYIGPLAFSMSGLEKATFENTEGWVIQESYDSTDRKSISKEDLEKPSNAAFYLRDSYSGYEWLIPDDYEKPGVRISTFAAILLIILLVAITLLPFAAMIALIVLAVRAVSGPRKDLKKQKAINAKRKKQMMVAGGVGLAGLAFGLIALLTKKKK